jgi:N-acetyl-gamma-glutamyl-phosphate reductase
MKPKIYVDGQEGTTGLRIHELLAQRSDLEVLKIDPERRKDPAARAQLLNAADIVFLCLPDAASKEAVGLITNPATRVIDASTAFRTAEGWVYGLPELSKSQRQQLRAAKRIANPGCHATAFLLSVAPLVHAGVINPATQLGAFSLTGYSGGGKKMIAQYQDPAAPPALKAPRHYALKLAHKHLPEMRVHAGLEKPPLFTPVVCNIYAGLAVEVFVPASALSRKLPPAEIRDLLAAHYAGEPFIRVMPYDPNAAEGLDDGFLDITACNNTNNADIFIFGSGDQLALICRLDNLGKGASGAAIQSMNLALGFEEGAGLVSQKIR